MTKAFGFGSGAEGGSTVTSVRSVEELQNALKPTAGETAILDGRILELEGNTYDFAKIKTGERKFLISGAGTTIRGKRGAEVVLKNFSLLIDLSRRNSLVIENLAFRADGAKSGSVRDGIDLVAKPVAGTSTERSSIRITHCSFDGHFDIAIDSHNAPGNPRLLVTVDHCLFFDSRAGEDGPDDATFVNRGAINVDVGRNNKKDPRQPGNSKFTVANNVFIDVWRRSPRVAEDNFGHVFNNLLYRWGYTKKASKDNTWRGMEVGGGETAEQGKPNGTAVIQANRFIPWDEKPQPSVAIKVHKSTTVDFGGAPLPNVYDDPKGKNGSNPFTEGEEVDVERFYAEESIAVPKVTAAKSVNWTKLLEDAGPEAFRGADAIRKKLQGLL